MNFLVDLFCQMPPPPPHLRKVMVPFASRSSPAVIANPPINIHHNPAVTLRVVSPVRAAEVIRNTCWLG